MKSLRNGKYMVDLCMCMGFTDLTGAALAPHKLRTDWTMRSLEIMISCSPQLLKFAVAGCSDLPFRALPAMMGPAATTSVYRCALFHPDNSRPSLPSPAIARHAFNGEFQSCRNHLRHRSRTGCHGHITNKQRGFNGRDTFVDWCCVACMVKTESVFRSLPSIVSRLASLTNGDSINVYFPMKLVCRRPRIIENPCLEWFDWSVPGTVCWEEWRWSVPLKI